MNVVLLHNPRAGDQELSTDELCQLLRANGFEPRSYSLKEDVDNEALLHHGEFVVVAGGDGSVRKAALRLAHTKRPIAPLPLGTANNIATSLGITGTPEEIVRGWRAPLRGKLDLGIVTGPWGTERFVEGVGLGLAARAIEIIREIADASGHEYENSRDELQRDLSLWFALAHEIAPLNLTIESTARTRREDYLLVEVLNIAQAGPRIEFAPKADPSDGLLDLVTATTADREKLAEVIGNKFRQTQCEVSLPADRVSRVRITTDACQVRIDDKQFDARSASTENKLVTIEIAIDPGALEIVFPARR